jgi:hypothetical protein
MRLDRKAQFYGARHLGTLLVNRDQASQIEIYMEFAQ